MTKKISISIPPLFPNDEVLDGGFTDLKDVVLDDEVLEGDSYTGELKDGLPHGQGTMNYHDGHQYVGEWRGGFRNGHGVYTAVDGATHTGEWKDGLPHGQGSYTFSTGEYAWDTYVGEWRDEKYSGQGTYTRADGGKYVGEWKDNNLWNGTEYDNDGKVVATWSKGVEKEE